MPTERDLAVTYMRKVATGAFDDPAGIARRCGSTESHVRAGAATLLVVAADIEGGKHLGLQDVRKPPAATPPPEGMEGLETFWVTMSWPLAIVSIPVAAFYMVRLLLEAN